MTESTQSQPQTTTIIFAPTSPLMRGIAVASDAIEPTPNIILALERHIEELRAKHDRNQRELREELRIFDAREFASICEMVKGGLFASDFAGLLGMFDEIDKIAARIKALTRWRDALKLERALRKDA
jgi:hypothetical protein